MSMYPPIPDPPPVHTTELDWADQARSDGWMLSGGQWQHPDRVNSFDDGDWVYLGDGIWEDAFVASLPSDARSGIMQKYSDLLAWTPDDTGPTKPSPPGPNLPPQAPPPQAAQSLVLALAWFPASDYPEALAKWPQLATEGAARGGKDHAAYNRALERTLRDYTDAGVHQLLIAPIRIGPFLAWCADRGKDPADARAGYCADLARRQDPSLIAWPPGRNARCWCGSGRKYKHCCGSAIGTG